MGLGRMVRRLDNETQRNAYTRLSRYLVAYCVFYDTCSEMKDTVGTTMMSDGY